MSNNSKKSNRVIFRIPDPDVWKDFLEFVEEKYGSSYAVTGIEAQKAIKYHMAMEGWKNYPDMIQDGIIIEKPKEHTRKIGSDDRIIIQTIYDRIQPGTEVYFNTLRKWIVTECGLKDKRTHKDHIDVLVALGVLKDLEGNYTAYEVLEPGDI